MMRFVVNSMLGSLARWLRILGYDTLYFRNVEDWLLIKVAKDESRILLTRDVSLYRKALSKGIKCVYIDTTEDIAEILAHLSARLGISLMFKDNNTRCPQCNTPLTCVSKGDVIHLVPKDVGLRHDKFWKCPKCSKVYWQGNHWKTINDILNRANSRYVTIKYGVT